MMLYFSSKKIEDKEGNSMEYRKLGNTGLDVSIIAPGCEAFVEDNSNTKKS